MTVNRDDLVANLAGLVRINSVSPALVPGASGEGEIAGYVARRLDGAGLGVRILESVPGRPSVAARLAGIP